MKKVTRADVAADAGVTPTIVSFVVNNNRYVSKEKRKRVLESIEKLGYIPDATARALKGKSSGHILLLINNLHSPHYLELIDEIENQSFSRGCIASLCRMRKDDDFLKNILSRNYDAVLMDGGNSSRNVAQALISSGTPTVVLQSSVLEKFDGKYGIIDTGLYEGTKDCIERIYEKGRKRVAYVHRMNHGLDDRDYRYKGYLDSVRNEPIILSGHTNNEELSRNVVEAYLKYHFDAIFCRDDNLAITALFALERKGIPVPQDVSVVGLDGTKNVREINPTLASLKIDRASIVSTFFEQVEKLKKGEQPDSVVLKCEFVEGESLK